MSEPIEQQLYDTISEAFEQSGLYVHNLNIGLVPNMTDLDSINPEELQKMMEEESMDDLADKIKDGTLQVVIQGAFRIGQVAWSERVLDPEKFNEKKAFEAIMPPEREIEREAAARDLLDFDWDTDDEQDDKSDGTGGTAP